MWATIPQQQLQHFTGIDCDNHCGDGHQASA